MSVELVDLKVLEVRSEKHNSIPISEHHEHHILQPPSITKVLDVKNADYALALSTGQQLSPICLRSLQLYLIFLVPIMGSLAYGFDGSGEPYSNIKASYVLKYNSTVMGIVIGMPYVSYRHSPALTLTRLTVFNRQYLEYFKIDAADAAGGVGSITALIFGVVSLRYILTVNIFT
jgi:hypothetical protein